MTQRLLLRQFDRLSDDAEAIPRLRRFVLELAVRGQLVEPGPTDTRVETLIKQIESTPREVPLAPRYRSLVDAPIDTPAFQLPAHWTWTRLGRIADYMQRGKSPKYSAAPGPLVVSQKCVRWEGLDLGPARTITSESLKAYEQVRILRDGDLLWNSTGTGTIGRLSRVVLPPDGLVCDSHVTLVRCSRVNPEFIRCWLRSDYVYGTIEGDASGSTNQVELTLQMALSQPVPLPPLAEQDRIVAKVEELMALCDQLEGAQKERELHRDSLRAVSLHRLTATPARSDTTDVSFFLKRSERLITKPGDVSGVRSAILDLAVKGRLVPQSPEEEPTSSLLATSDQVRTRLAENDRRASASQQELLAAELRWSVPASWRWRGLADLVLFVDYRGRTPEKATSGVRLITAKNVRRGHVSLEPEEFISDAEYARSMTRGLPEAGNVLFTTEAPLGNAAVVRLAEQFALAQRVISFKSYGSIDPDFLALQLIAVPFTGILKATATGLTAKGIKAAKLKRLPTAVPPLAEQHRIVAKVDELMTLCEALEAALAASQYERVRLLEALLHEVLNHSSRPDGLFPGSRHPQQANSFATAT